MMSEKTYHVLAYYAFTPVADPHLEVSRHLDFLKGKDIRCRVYISEQGINGQMSAEVSDSLVYQEWLKADCRFQGVRFKIHNHKEHAFPRVTVKYRKQIVALDEEVDLSQMGERLSPQKWKEMLSHRDPETLLLDVRNAYEWEIGHFEGAELPPLEHFRQFPSYARALKERYPTDKTKIMMYCTGGIRCELYSALMKQVGFEQVYQLDGGVIGYGLEEGGELWRGKLFVFDDRLAVPLVEGEEGEVISHCSHCGNPSDVYYNCANMDCNELFLSCLNCANATKGCCSQQCQGAPRLRLYESVEKPKPFRRQHML